MKIFMAGTPELQTRSDIAVIDSIAEMFEDAPRQGADTDDPEGTRFIVISDTLAVQLAASLRTALARLVTLH